MKLENIERAIEAYRRSTEEYCDEASIPLTHIPIGELKRIIGPHIGPEKPNPPFFDYDPFYATCYEVTPSIAEDLTPYLAESKKLNFSIYNYYMCAYGDGTPIEDAR